MKKMLSSLLVSGLALFTAAPALAENLDFTLINRTGYVISEVHVSSASSDDWEEDVMGQDVLGDGERVDIAFEKGSQGCKWDLKVTYDDEEEAVWKNFDLCSISEIALRYDRKKGRTWANVK
ncbi:MAG: argininosuccinate lyase [Gammaproteobacteria bacterium]